MPASTELAYCGLALAPLTIHGTNSGGFLRVLELDATDASCHRDAYGRLRAGELQAILVHGVYEHATVAAAVERLEGTIRRFSRPGSQSDSGPGFTGAISI